MMRAGALLALMALFGAAPFEYETMPPDRFWQMNMMWTCCYPAKNPQRGPVVGGYAFSLAAPRAGHLADPLALNIEIQDVAAPTHKLPLAPGAVLELTVASTGRIAHVWSLRNPFLALSGVDLPPGRAEQVKLRWFEDYEFFRVPGRYALRLSTQLLIAGSLVTLSSNDAIVTISAALPGNRFVPTPTPAPTPFSDAVAVVYLGARLPVIVEVRNVSREVQYVSFGLWITDYDFDVRDVVTRKVVPRDPSVRLLTITRMPWAPPQAVPPGRSIFGLIDINHIYPIKTVGTYRVRVTRDGRGFRRPSLGQRRSWTHRPCWCASSSLDRGCRDASRTSHAGVDWALAALRGHPGNDLIGIGNVARLAVHAVGEVDL
jgi:hypothetical protein